MFEIGLKGEKLLYWDKNAVYHLIRFHLELTISFFLCFGGVSCNAIILICNVFEGKRVFGCVAVVTVS